MSDWKPTYDTFADREKALADAARRTKHAKQAGHNSVFAVKRTTRGRHPWTVMYREGTE